MSSVLLVDGDLLCYKHAAGSATTIDWGDGVTSKGGSVEVAYRMVLGAVTRVQEQVGCRKFVWCFSDTENFRKAILPSYKQNRTGEKPVALSGLVQKIKDQFGDRVYVRPGLEADDVLGILATNPKLLKGHRKVVYSGDKDMQQLPAEVFNGKTLRKITPEQADRFFFEQVLIGDSTDNYAGCPGIGPVKAAKLLEGVQDGRYWEAIVAAYQKAGLTEADALVQARVARILRSSDFNYTLKEPKLWTPA
jgi:DNA polymerase-1